MNIIDINERKTDLRRFFEVNNDGTLGRIIPRLIVEEIEQKNPIMYTDSTGFYIYRNGVFKIDSVTGVNQLVREKLGNFNTTTRMVNEVVNYIRDTRRITNEGGIFNRYKYLVNVRNGSFNLETGTFVPKESGGHTPLHRSTIQLPIEYNPLATCDEIDDFLRSVLPEDAIPVIYEWFGYCMVQSCKFEKSMFLVGEGANGKSKLIELMQAFTGAQNASAVPLSMLEDFSGRARFAAAALENKLVNVCADISAKEMRETGAFKDIVSGGTLQAERKYQDSYTFNVTAKLMYSANTLPASTDTTRGFFRRMLIVPMNRIFEGKERDVNLIKRLTTPEQLSGLLNKALEGYYRLEKNGGFTPSESINAALEMYKISSNPVARFLSEECEKHDGATIPKKTLFDAYARWFRDCEFAGRPVGRYDFYRDLENNHNISASRFGSVRCYEGIKIRSDSDYYKS